MSNTAELPAVRKPYKHHPIVRDFPEIEGDEREARKASIRAKGVLQPLLVWTRPETGDAELVDGRTREDLYWELVDEGQLDPAKQPLVYANIGAMSEEDMVGYVFSIQLERRHCSSSQRAALTVVASDRWKKLHARGQKRLPKEERDAPDAVAAKAEDLAKMAGTNRSYLFLAQTLHEEAPDLLKEVIAGRVNLPEAETQLRRRKMDAERGPAAAGGNGGPAPAGEAPAAKAEEEPVLDGLKEPVAQKALRAAFAARDDFRAAAGALRKVKTLCADLADGPGGKWLPGQEVNAYLNNALRLLTKHQPHVPCPACAGTGKHEGDKSSRKKCDKCEGKAYLDVLRFNKMTGAEGGEEGDGEG